MTNFTISADEFRALVSPVMPLASKDADYTPTLNAVLIEGDGKWLSATATDRFRMGIKRIAKRATDDDPATEWPEFRALVPLRSVKSLLTTFKTLRGSLPAQITFTIGEYPKVRSLVQQTLDIAVEDRVSAIHLNPFFLADWKAVGSKNLRLLIGKANGAVLVTDDEGFIGLQMSRRPELPAEDWSDFFSPKKANEKAA
jgi:hypothetical protein